MKNVFTALLLMAVCFSPVLKAQSFTAESPVVELNFGYPVLQVMDDLSYIDENENNQLEPNEAGVINFTLVNNGKYPALGVVVRPKELNGVKGLDLPEEVLVGNIPVGGKKLVQIGVAGSATLSVGTASFIFYIRENGEDGNISVVYALNTGKRR